MQLQEPVLARSLGTRRSGLLLRWMNSTVVDLIKSTLVEIVVEFCIETNVLKVAACWARKKAR